MRWLGNRRIKDPQFFTFEVKKHLYLVDFAILITSIFEKLYFLINDKNLCQSIEDKLNIF